VVGAAGFAAEGRDPAREKAERRASKPDSFEMVATQFIEKYAKRKHGPKYLEATEGMFRRHVLPRWRSRGIESISRADVRDLVQRIAEDAPIAANRTYEVIRKLFNWSIEQDIVAVSPCAGLKPPSDETSRDRVLSDSELRLVWHAAKDMGPPYGPTVQLLALTGQRLSEVANMEWSELDFENRLWVLPRERVKNGVCHEVPLSARAVAVIRQVPRVGDQFVFSTNGRAPASNFGKNKRRLDALLPDMPQWVLHDLRRSVASSMAKLGVNLPVIEKVLNHVSGSFAGIVGVYQHHTFADEKRAALELWGTHVEHLVSDKPAKVVALRAKAK
jgi:integrase